MVNFKKINTAIVSPEFPPKTNWGGLATFNLNLSIALKKICKHVDVITFDGVGATNQKIEKGNLTIHYIKMKTDIKLLNFLYYKFPIGPARNLIKKNFPDLLFAFEWNIFSLLYFSKNQQQLKVDVIHSPTYYFPAFLIKTFFSKIKLINHLHGHLKILNKYNFKTAESSILEKIESYYINHFSDVTISCSKSIKTIYLKENPHVKIVHIPNFIISSKIRPTSGTINKNRLVYYGRIEYRKGVDILIKSFLKLAKKNHKLKLYLIGDKLANFRSNSKPIEFEKFFEKLKIPENIKTKIYFLPKINDSASIQEIVKLIGGVMVVPSRYEPFGYTIIESMALGLLVIASNQGGGSEIIDNGKDGFLFNPNISSLTKILITMYKTPDKRITEMTILAQKKVLKKYGLEEVLKKYKEVYAGCLT
jgi:glycosyltransferase involved in cell wall biosynthesis